MRHADKTHCKYGHEYTAENTYHTQSGSRKCRECKRRRNRAHFDKLPKQRDRKAAAAIARTPVRTPKCSRGRAAKCALFDYTVPQRCSTDTELVAVGGTPYRLCRRHWKLTCDINATAQGLGLGQLDAGSDSAVKEAA